MRLIVCLVGMAAVISFAATPVAPPEVLLGVWVLSKESATVLPHQCGNIRIELTSEGYMLATSGEFTSITSVEFSISDAGFTIRKKFTVHNGKPNCQGRSAEYVVAHTLSEEYVEISGSTLRDYAGPKADQRYLVLVRE